MEFDLLVIQKGITDPLLHATLPNLQHTNLDLEVLASKNGFGQILLEVRKTQKRAIMLYEGAGYIKWGSLPTYHNVNNELISGNFYYKLINSKLK